MRQENLELANLSNLKLLESLYESWEKNSSSVDLSWKNFFEGMQLGASLQALSPSSSQDDHLKIYTLIQAYRTFGHLMAGCDVLALKPVKMPPQLNLNNFGFTEADLTHIFPLEGLLKKKEASLKEVVEVLQTIYCQKIGIEYMHVDSTEVKNWIQSQIEPALSSSLTREDQLQIFQGLISAEGFETFLHTKYVGQKRFSLEGEETFIPFLQALIEEASHAGVSEIVLGMAHRGRLNVLTNILGKPYRDVFREFEGGYIEKGEDSSGDVKYHLGFKGSYTTRKGEKVALLLAANPSHLESVDPVVEGSTRGIQEDKKPHKAAKQVLPLLIHGDASIAGQGIVYETMTLSGLEGYETQGTIHVVLNNQIGFTTAAKESRSTRYCTDIAKAFGAPIFHVSAEDPEGCILVAILAVKLRQQFGMDVFIDLMGYRKYGHNEGDEPTFTQPLEYQLIRSKKTIRELYREHLIAAHVLTEEEAEKKEAAFRSLLNQALEEVKKGSSSYERKEKKSSSFEKVTTEVSKEMLLALGKALFSPSESLNLHPKLKRLLEERQNMLLGEPNSLLIDWGVAEMLSYATLSVEGIHVRLSGQDVMRGTFSHRHAVYVDQVSGSLYFPLKHLKEAKALCEVFNSPLSEMGVLGFEYGYSLTYPNSLVLWEAQFGDFANSAQVVIDHYLANSEVKWGQKSNLTVLLPHGYEGQGPEHSSARIERFLQLAAEENIRIANCTTPAQFFHLLRQQAKGKIKKPLIVFTPKVLLRHPECKSSLNQLALGEFETILDDIVPALAAKRLLLCSGKFFYELSKEREKRKSPDVILRIEQLYPFDQEKLKALIQKYKAVEECLYVQEEHQNMGAWNFLNPLIKTILPQNLPLKYVGRAEGAAQAAGSYSLHALQHETLMKELFGAYEIRN